MKRAASVVLALGLSSLLAGCAAEEDAANEVLLVRGTTSFGFCVGYCRTSLEITPSALVWTESANPPSTLPPLTRTASLTPAEWRNLVAAVDRSRLESLPPLLGCPDCADGGAESVAVVAAAWSKQVTFEHGAGVPSIQALVDRVRELRGRFRPAAD